MLYIYIFFLDLEHPEVLSIFLDEGRKVQTTRSWDFLGLEKDNVIPQNSAWNKGRFGEDVIIGVIDSGLFWFNILNFTLIQ